MIVLAALLTGIALAAVVGTIRSLGSDGYRKQPTAAYSRTGHPHDR